MDAEDVVTRVHSLPAGDVYKRQGLGMPAVLGDARPAEGEAGAAHQAGQAAVIPCPVEKPHEQQPVHQMCIRDRYKGIL